MSGKNESEEKVPSLSFFEEDAQSSFSKTRYLSQIIILLQSKRSILNDFMIFSLLALLCWGFFSTIKYGFTAFKESSIENSKAELVVRQSFFEQIKKDITPEEVTSYFDESKKVISQNIAHHLFLNGLRSHIQSDTDKQNLYSYSDNSAIEVKQNNIFLMDRHQTFFLNVLTKQNFDLSDISPSKQNDMMEVYWAIKNRNFYSKAVFGENYFKIVRWSENMEEYYKKNNISFKPPK